MAEISVLPKRSNPSLIEGLERLLERARSGEIEAIAYVALRPDQKFESNKIGHCSTLEMVGALEFVKADIVRDA